MSNWFKIGSFLYLLSSQLNAQDLISIGERHTFFSKILNEEREVWVHLPKSYHSTDILPTKYPVIYVLDANINFEYFAPMTDFLSKNPYADIPETIVVGIVNTDRTRDFTPTKSSMKSYVNPKEILFENSGGSAQFLDYIQKELKPFIGEHFRADNFSILMGHSFGGLFAINCLVSKPEYFNAYVANDPSLWWDNQVMIGKTKDFLKKKKTFSTPKILFVSEANHEKEEGWGKETSSALKKFKEVLNSTENLTQKFNLYPEEMHGTVSYPASYDALKFIFKGFKTDVKELSQNPSSLEKSYQNFSEKMGFGFRPSESYLNYIVNFMKKNGYKNAELYFTDLKERYYDNP